MRMISHAIISYQPRGLNMRKINSFRLSEEALARLDDLPGTSRNDKLERLLLGTTPEIARDKAVEVLSQQTNKRFEQLEIGVQSMMLKLTKRIALIEDRLPS